MYCICCNHFKHKDIRSKLRLPQYRGPFRSMCCANKPSRLMLEILDLCLVLRAELSLYLTTTSHKTKVGAYTLLRTAIIVYIPAWIDALSAASFTVSSYYYIRC